MNALGGTVALPRPFARLGARLTWGHPTPGRAHPLRHLSIIRRLGLSAGALVAFLSLALTVIPRTGLYSTFVVLSPSMAPTIPMGSVVVVRAVDPAKIRVGDIITFSSRLPPYPTLSHRVQTILQTEDGIAFKTRGDANVMDDPWEVNYARRGGKVVLAIPAVGYLVAATNTDWAHYVLGVVLGSALAAFWLRTVWTGRSPVVAAAHASGSGAPGRRVAGADVSLVRIAILGWLALCLVMLVRRGAGR